MQRSYTMLQHAIKLKIYCCPELNSKWGTICTPVEILAPDGKQRKTQAADLEGIFRLIQSIPSKKAEPVKAWLAEVGASDYIMQVESQEADALPLTPDTKIN